MSLRVQPMRQSHRKEIASAALAMTTKNMISDTQYLTWQKKLTTNQWFRRFWVFLGIYVTGFFYAGVVLFFMPEYRKMAFLAFVAFILAKFVICSGINVFYKKPRPYQRLNFYPPESKIFISWVNKKSDSFPSGHAASFVAISVVCLYYFPLLGILGLVLTMFNARARMISGYHYINDIMAGWLVGILSALITIIYLSPLIK